MNKRQLEIFKTKLEENGFDSQQWETWLIDSATMCELVASVLRETDPCDKSTIGWLEEVGATLSHLAEDEERENTPGKEAK